MNNPEKPAPLGTHDTRRRQTKQKHNAIIIRNYDNKNKQTYVPHQTFIAHLFNLSDNNFILPYPGDLCCTCVNI